MKQVNYGYIFLKIACDHFWKRRNKTKIIFKRNPQIQRIPWVITIMFSKKTTINTAPNTSQNTPSKIKTLIISLHLTNTSSSSSLSLTNSLILSLELKNSRSSKKNERRGKPILLSLLFFHCCNWVSTRKEIPCCIFLLNSYKVKWTFSFIQFSLLDSSLFLVKNMLKSYSKVISIPKLLVTNLPIIRGVRSNF